VGRRAGKRYGGSRRRMQQLVESKAVPAGVWIVWLLALFLVLVIFSWFDHAWPAGDQMGTHK
jgi:hypothetical protein